MKIKRISGVLFILFVSLITSAANTPKVNTTFLKGETLEYKARWGLLTIGHAQTKIDSKVYMVQSHPCFKIEVKGQTNGLASLFYVKDSWSSYIDTSDLITHRTSRSIREGHYVLDEMANFDHQNKRIAVSIMDQKQQKFNDPKYYEVPENVTDLIGGFMLMRLRDFSDLKKNDTIKVTGFFEDRSYEMNIVYLGKEIINTSRGKVRCLLLRPIMPDNKLLNGKHSVDVWMSDDDSQTLMRIRAKMFLGTFNIELD
jgi:hypothetical protein